MRIFFKLPSQLSLGRLGIVSAPKAWPQEYLAYVEWYSAPSLSASAATSYNMARVDVTTSLTKGPDWSIIPLTNIRQSCMLFPHFKRCPPQVGWTCDNVLDNATSFLVSNWSSLYAYKTIYVL